MSGATTARSTKPERSLVEAVSGQHRRPSRSGFTDLPPAWIAMEAGAHSIWISEQLQELGHGVIVANVRELRAISHSDRKSDHLMPRRWRDSRTWTRRSCGPSRIAQSNSKKHLR